MAKTEFLEKLKRAAAMQAEKKQAQQERFKALMASAKSADRSQSIRRKML